MLSHAHAFRPGFALPKAIARAGRALRAFGNARHKTLAADFGPHLRADLGLEGGDAGKPVLRKTR